MTYKIIITRIEELITEYTKNHDSDTVTQKLMETVKKVKSEKLLKFYDVAFLSGIFNVSPDYITGISDDPEPQNTPFAEIISAASVLDEWFLEDLAQTAKQFLKSQNNKVDFEEAGIAIKRYPPAKRSVYKRPIKPQRRSSMIADSSKEYKTDK